VYPAETLDGAGAPTTELDGYDYREGDGYLFTVKASFDVACDMGELQLFVEGDKRIRFTAANRVPDGVVEFTPEDLRHFEPGEIIDLEYYTVDSEDEIEELNREFEPPDFVEEFPAMRSYFVADWDTSELQECSF
jgi:hypothetical protein